MKKILCLFLAVVLMLSLVACGNKKNKEPQIDETIPETVVPTETNPSSDETTPEESKPETDNFLWLLKDNITPQFEDITYKEVEIDEDIVKVSKTTLSFDADAIIEKLNKNDYIANQVDNLFCYKSEDHTTKTIDNKIYNLIYDDEIIVDNNGITSAVKISSSQLRNYYESPIEIVLELSHLEKDTLNQSAIFDAVSVVFPDLAEYLVYGKDLDGYFVDSQDALYGELDMEELIGNEDYSYKVYRTVSDYGTTIFVKFGVSVYKNNFEDFAAHVFPDESYIYEKSNFTTEEMFSDNYSELNPFNYKDFMNDFFGEDLAKNHHSKMDYWSYYTYENETETCYLSTMKIELINNDTGYTDATFSVYISTSLVDGKISSQLFEIRTWARDLVDPDLKKHGEVYAEKFKLLIDGLNIENLEYFDDSKTACSGNATCTLNNCELTGNLNVSFSISPSATLRLQYYG